ncbi:hypothetical protein AALB19_00960 [Oscillospiraceae bacterium 50-58]|jgi:hypothetical protein|nr:hypothetical protein [Oscillospiraceae bacterium]
MNRSSISKWVLSMLLWMWAGGVYFFLEVAWKTSQGRPESISWTMFLLAIILAVPLERFGAELPWEMPLVGQACICTVAITVVEFVAGVILNVWLNLGVWDYSHLPGNVMGQICPEFAFLWFFLSIVGIVMLDWMRYAVEGGERPHYT